MRDFKILDVTEKNPIHLDIDVTAEKKIYHYTNLKGLIGILGSNSLWATRTDYLNDNTETVYIKTVIEKVIEKLNLNEEYDSCDTNFFFYNKIVEYLYFLSNEFRKNNNKCEDDFALFTISMSEDGDSWPLFTKYSTLNGYNIEFEIKKLLNFKLPCGIYIEYNDVGVTAGRVIYSIDKQVSILYNDILNLYKMIFIKFKEKSIHIINQKVYDQISYEITEYILIKLAIYSIFFKNKYFYKEEEYRIAFLCDSRSKMIKYHEKNGMKTPYIEFKFDDKLPITRITKAPQNNYNIENIISSTKYKNINIIKSDQIIYF